MRLSFLLREEVAVAFGFRDAETADECGSSDVRHTAMHVLELTEVRRLGAAAAARNAIAMLERSDLGGFWIHLDADVLNDEVMPAVDYRMPDGLWPEELTDAFAVVLNSPFAIRMDVTVYNPTFDDSERSATRVLAQTITAAFAKAI